MFTMISILHRIFIFKAKRVYNPPRIIKDADEIMRRTFKKLIQIKDTLLNSAVIRWKNFKNICKIREKSKILFKIHSMSENRRRDAFYR